MTKEEKLSDIHAQAMIEFDKCQDAFYEERKQCLEDRRFATIPGAQWEGSLSEQFENKPRYEINKVQLSLIRIYNDYRNNRISVDFVSKDGTDTSSLADTCDGMLRADMRDSGADEALDNAFEEAAAGGYGALRLCNKYEDEEDDENEKQRIRIEPIYDADSSVYFDIDAKRQDKADAKYCFVVYSMSPDQYEKEYPDFPLADIGKQVDDTEYDWYTPDLVHIAEYYLVEHKKETVVIFKGTSGDEVRYTREEMKEDPEIELELLSTGYEEDREKRVTKKKVHKYILSGNDVLEDCGYIAGKCIPVIPAYGKRWFIEGVERCMGHVRLVKDVQRIKNMLTSWLAEIAALTPREKPILHPEQVAGVEHLWATDNIKNRPYMLVNRLTDKEGNPMAAGPVAYTKLPAIPPALAALLQIVDIDMKDILGNQEQGDKMVSNISGKAVEMIQKRIDGQAFIYMSNFAKTVQRLGEVWLSMAKDVYVEKGRKMKTLGVMGEVGTVELQRPIQGDHGMEYENDMSEASFDVAVDVGPASSTQREAVVKSLMGMLQFAQSPQDAQVLTSMIMMNMEGDGLGDVKEYYRKQLVQMGVLEPTDEEAKMMAAQAQEESPNDRALNAMADEAEAKAAKTRVEVAKVLSETEENKAQTAKIYNDIQSGNIQTVSNIITRR